MDAFVHSVETAGALDGPGLRYVLFLKGCPFRCKFCHNPDTWTLDGANKKSLSEILADIQKYEDFFKFTKGGVTVSGGEPLMQAQFTAELFCALKKRGLHTCLDTCGHADIKNQYVRLCAENSDLVMLDIKHLDKSVHKEITGCEISKTLEFLELLESLKKRVWLRIVMLSGISDTPEYAKKLATFVKQYKCVELVELLPYHTLGVHKWHALKIDYAYENMEPPSKLRVEAFEKFLNENGIKTLRKI